MIILKIKRLEMIKLKIKIAGYDYTDTGNVGYDNADN